jgi:hydroxyethylthiazole kinase-like uncharacterized protein yjeF
MQVGALVNEPFELLTNAEMGMADRLTIESGTPGIVLMERAGAAIADAARQMLARSGGRRVAILCGPGNNGGDGFVAARLLRQMGFSVEAGLLGTMAALKGDAAIAASAWTGRTGSAALVALDDADLVIDALFGAGLARDIDGRARSIVERLNAWRDQAKGTIARSVLAVDVPSGVDGDTGAVRGVAVEADVTVTFFTLKPGHLLLPGRLRCGRIVLADIGIARDVLDRIRPQTFANVPGLWRRSLPLPQVDGHKYSRGHALVLSGPAHQTGAARLAARAALRAGAGLVTMAAQGEAVAVNAAHLTAVMIAPFEGPVGLRKVLDDRRKNVIAMGPGAGAGPATLALVRCALGHANAPSVVLDADALTSFHRRFDEFRTLVRGHDRPVVATPHEGEFARLFKDSQAKPESFSEAGSTSPEVSDEEHESLHEVGPDSARIGRAAAAARSSGAILVLKGPDTIVAHPDGRLAVMADASPWLATAGSGDVLTGIVAGLLAQGMPGFEAASAAVWMHAAAAKQFGPGLIAEDLPDCLPAVWRQLGG